MKNSKSGCEILDQILQQIQETEQEKEFNFLLTIKFNRLLKKFYQAYQTRSEQLRALKQAKVYLEYTKKKRLFVTFHLL